MDKTYEVKKVCKTTFDLLGAMLGHSRNVTAIMIGDTCFELDLPKDIEMLTCDTTDKPLTIRELHDRELRLKAMEIAATYSLNSDANHGFYDTNKVTENAKAIYNFMKGN